MELWCIRPSRATGLLLDDLVHCTTPNTGKRTRFPPGRSHIFDAFHDSQLTWNMWQYLEKLDIWLYPRRTHYLTRNDYVDSILKLVHIDPITLRAMETLQNKCEEPFSAPLHGYRVLIIKTRHKQSLMKVS